MTLEKIHEKFDIVHLDSLKIFENAKPRETGLKTPFSL